MCMHSCLVHISSIVGACAHSRQSEINGFVLEWEPRAYHYHCDIWKFEQQPRRPYFAGVFVFDATDIVYYIRIEKKSGGIYAVRRVLPHITHARSDKWRRTRELEDIRTHIILTHALLRCSIVMGWIQWCDAKWRPYIRYLQSFTS